MANVRLSIREAERGPLPEVCMKCGQPSELSVTKKLSWHPSWVYLLLFLGLLPLIIVALIMTKRATLVAPMCAAHKGHWWKRSAGILLGLLGLICVVVTLASVLPSNRGMSDTKLAIIAFTIVIGLVVWIGSIIVMNMTMIRATEITERDVTLQGVSDEFVKRIDAMGEVEDEDDRRPLRRSASTAVRRDRDD